MVIYEDNGGLLAILILHSASIKKHISKKQSCLLYQFLRVLAEWLKSACLECTCDAGRWLATQNGTVAPSYMKRKKNSGKPGRVRSQEECSNSRWLTSVRCSRCWSIRVTEASPGRRHVGPVSCKMDPTDCSHDMLGWASPANSDRQTDRQSN